MDQPDHQLPHGQDESKTGKGLFDLSARLRAAKFDLAILLPNSFKSALICKMANIPRVVGYDRDGRSFLLTDRLLPIKEKGKFVPSPIIHAYMGLARYLGATTRDLRWNCTSPIPTAARPTPVFTKAGARSVSLHRPAAAGGPPLGAG